MGADGWALLGSLLAGIESGWSPACDAEQPGLDEWGVVKVSAVTSGRFIDGEAKRLPMGQVQRPELEIKRGDVLLARANGARSLVGVSCYVTATRPRLMLSDKVLRLAPDRTAVDPVYLAILLGTPGVRRQIGNLLNGGTGQNNITQDDVRTLKIPRLPLPEQRDIVAAHEAFERRIGALERELAKLATLRRGIVDERATGPDARLGDLLTESPKNGYSASEVHEWTGMLVLGLGCLTNDGFVPRQLKRIPKSPLAERFRLADGDLLMSRANTRELVGLAARFRDVGQPCSYPDLMMRLRPDEGRCLTAYLELVLGSSRVRRDVQAGARGTSESMVKISAGTVESLRIPLPTIAEQRKAVDAVTSVDQRSATVRVLLAKLRVTQRAVVEDLLSGRSRVNRT
ncbi:restriction endonuclease subunit S [Streptomyces lancefieldiae]|uniref:Type I restriction modification DNA specificity domain-containing protein n=1 Tax=Streptomyces lancefieldiae TaxID=3075520 RepID=A0ABU3AGT9_9ACTN|nr:hypothetical protein [Streptomyces sp. DSM 40712]MDT0609399.1 hypothetical protein [Streptomyces sp. DSM 40712]